MFKSLRSKVAGLFLTGSVIATQAVAAISPTDETSILAGVASSDALFYKVGGAILVVMAGIWGFKRVRAML